MLVTRIDVIGLGRNETDCGHVVTVCLHGADRRVFTRCEVGDKEVLPGDDFESAVARRVVRQLRQMPEFRSGEDLLEVDPALVPPMRQSA